MRAMRRTRRNPEGTASPVPQTQIPAFRRWFGDSKVVDENGEPLVVYHGTDKGGFYAFDMGEADRIRKNMMFFTDDYGMAQTYTRGRGDPTPPIFPSVEAFLRYVKTEGDDSPFTVETDEDDDGVFYTVFSPDGYKMGDFYADNEQDMEALLSDVNSQKFDRAGVYEVYLRIVDPLVVDAKGANWDEIPMEDEDEDGNPRVVTYTTNELAHMARDMDLDGLIIRDVYDSGRFGRGAESGDLYVVFDEKQIKSAHSNVGTFDPNTDDIRRNPPRRRRRSNPEPTPSIRFVYGARRLARGGFAPVVEQHGPGRSAHEHGGWTGRGYDEDVALAVAKEHAEELASQYVGDWNIEIVPEFPSESPSEGRRNPDARITEEEARKKMKGEQGAFRALDQGARGICTAFEYPDGGVYALHRRRDGKIQGFYHHPPREWEAPRVFVDESPFAPRRNPRVGKMMEAFADLLKTKEDRDPPRPFIEGGKARIDLTYGKRDYEGDLEPDILRLKVGRSFVAAAAGELGSRVFAEHNTFTAPKHRGKGYMHLLYTTLLKDGIGIVSDKWNHSLPMRKVWMRLARDGWPVYAFTDEGEDVGGETMTRVPPDVTQDDPLLDEVLVVAPNREAFDRMFGEYGLDEGVAEHLRGGADSVYEGDEDEDD